MRAIIIGKSGQLAQELVATLPESIEAICLGSNEIDITKLADLEEKFNDYQPHVVINASAYTNVDKAESERSQAFLLNEEGVRNIAITAKKHAARFLHVSTDFVFDGSQSRAYSTTDETNPIGVYGASKLAGEKAIEGCYAENSAVVRTSWLYSEFGNNFVKTMLRLMKDKPALNVVADQIGCPTNAKGLAQFLWFLAQSESVDSRYHYSDLGVASWYDFAVAIQSIAYDKGILTAKIPVNPIPSEEYPTPAKRPAFSLMKTVRTDFNYHWQVQLEKVLDNLKVSL
ncbi:dTDP-4-dehydrorhamnose reductase [Pseudoalteromonas luteoviolacea]|uniref:dTDP-4-dehydrorhamnose reductase n=1 Tax=Pseudoalteromonas luteoviolacea S4060-1 TaxID=1365257 RepID=A0A167NM66_9GAMM|nr:dTDP-4-dehydrorhamnose reductase [Pseudoalteromonas luteoviolacea]KZN68482.1 hypothetical protein N478_15065 [Pseudoalteromonas luteoviolacea S4060-1]